MRTVSVAAAFGISPEYHDRLGLEANSGFEADNFRSTVWISQRGWSSCHSFWLLEGLISCEVR